METKMQRLIKLIISGYCLLISGSIFFATTAIAEEGGGGHVAPGGVATMIDAAPTRGGWVIESIFVNYNGEFSATSDIPIGGLDSLGLNADVDTLTFGALYTIAQPVWGAHYSVGAFVPYAWMELEGNVNDFEVRDTAQGIGDITLIPLMLAWTDDAWEYTASLSIYAPTGSYNVGNLANLGLNYWTIDPVVGAAYSNQDTGFNFGAYMGITFNSENDATDYDSGSLFHLEASVQQLFPMGSGFIGLGVDAFYFNQVSGDSGSGARTNFKGRTMGIGPVINYVLPVGTNNWVFEAKWLPESNTKNRLEGDYIWVKVVYQFE
jgi:hypothetical protein